MFALLYAYGKEMFSNYGIGGWYSSMNKICVSIFTH